MPVPTLLQPEPRLREFHHGDQTLSLPVDLLGRHRFRSALDTTNVDVGDLASLSAGDAIGFAGTAILFNKRTWIGPRDAGFWEQIAPQAVTKTLLEADVRFLQNHNPDLLLARTNPAMRAAGTATMRLLATPTGLRTEADMAPTSYARDLAILLERGDISQMSFAFDPIDWDVEHLADGTVLITITELRLFDNAVVTYPAYEETDAGLRAFAFDELCRNNGFDPAAIARGYATGGNVPDLRQIPTQPESARTKRARIAGSMTRSLNGWTLSDLWPLLDAAVVEQCSSPEFNAYWYVWIVDVSDEWFVYCDDRPGTPDRGCYYQVTYTIDADGTLVLGDAVEVVMKTTYLPVAADDSEDEPGAGSDPDPEGGEYSAPSPLAQRMLAQRMNQLDKTFAAAG